MKKTLYVTTAILATASSVEAKSDYIKLAKLDVTLTKSDLFKKVEVKDSLSTSLYENQICNQNGYDVIDLCPENGSCVPTYCPENPRFVKCSCFCAVNSCAVEGYRFKSCGKYERANACPRDKNFFKCEPMYDFEKCVVDEFFDKEGDCDRTAPNYTVEIDCPFDNTYKKCIEISDEEKCKEDGYVKTECKDGEALEDQCFHGDLFLYKNCEVVVVL